MLLLDEIEKAHPDVFNILLQLLDAGRLTDAQGRTVDFKNTVVIMTSNIGADRILTATASGTPDGAAIEEALMPMLRQITLLMLDDTRRRLAAQDITVEFSDAAIELLARQGFQPEFGARPLRRTIQRQVDNRLSAMLLAGTIDPGSHVRIDAKDGELTFQAEPGPTT